MLYYNIALEYIELNQNICEPLIQTTFAHFRWIVPFYDTKPNMHVDSSSTFFNFVKVIP